MTDKRTKDYVLIGLSIVAVIILISVFAPSSNENNSQNKITCNSPYIKVGNSCCLDQNYNNVCDNDEIKKEYNPSLNTNNEKQIEEQAPRQEEYNSSSNTNNEETSNQQTTYCGDGICQSDESCSSCSLDCGHCVLFEIGDSYGDSEASNYDILGKNYYEIIPSDSISAISFPLSFNNEARDITFSWMCYDGLGRLDSRPDTINPEGTQLTAYISEEGKSLGLTGYFGYGSAQTFILKNNLNHFGTEIEYISSGNARVILWPSSEWGSTRIFDCNLIITSHNPPHREEKSFKLKYT